MNSISKTQIAVLSILLTLPALLLCVGGVLYTAFGLAAANNLLDSIIATAPGRILLSPAVVLGGVFLSLALNLRTLCRVRIGLDTGRVYVTLWMARALRLWIFTAFVMLLAALLLAYAFVENFRIVAR